MEKIVWSKVAYAADYGKEAEKPFSSAPTFNMPVDVLGFPLPIVRTE